MLVRAMSTAAAPKNGKPQSVAIIGGGVAGLSCAQRLADYSDQGFRVTVFDTGRLRPGGRCSSRQANDRPKDDYTTAHPILSKYRYDHAAQVISVPKTNSKNNDDKTTTSAFQKQVQDWEKAGIVKQYPKNSVYFINSGRSINPIKTNNALYYGTDGMGAIPLSMIDRNKFELKQDVWVSPSNGAKYMEKTKQWKITGNGKALGMYDQLVIAHNGKCADRLMSKTPAKELHEKLCVNFAPNVPAHGGTRMTLNSIYSLTFATKSDAEFQKSLPNHFVFGYIRNHPALRSLTCQTRKFRNDNNKNDSDIQVWTILSSPTFAKKYKGPQEFLPPDTIETVSNLLLKALEESLTFGPQNKNNSQNNGNQKKNGNVPNNSKNNGNQNRNNGNQNKGDTVAKTTIPILDKRLQLWGAGVPLNVWCTDASNGDQRETVNPAGFIYDAENNAGVCGDWLVEPSIAGAWTSGQLLADHMAKRAQDGKQKSSVGLKGSFVKSESVARAGIGAFQ